MSVRYWNGPQFSYITGCSKDRHASAGCLHCWAEPMARRFPALTGGTWQPGTTHPRRLLEPFKHRGATRDGRRLLMPFGWMGDALHHDVSLEDFAAALGAIALNPGPAFLFLTKRADRLADLERVLDDAAGRSPLDRSLWCVRQLGRRLPDFSLRVHTAADRRAFDRAARAVMHVVNGLESPPTWPLRNLWWGVSVESQKHAERRLPALAAFRDAARRWCSYEPALGPVGLSCVYEREPDLSSGFCGLPAVGLGGFLDWVVMGAENGPGARPCEEAWARTVRDECAHAATPFLLKSLGTDRDTDRGPLLDGRSHSGADSYPLDLWYPPPLRPRR